MNQIPFAEREAIQAAWSELTGAAVDPAFSLLMEIPGSVTPVLRATDWIIGRRRV